MGDSYDSETLRGFDFKQTDISDSRVNFATENADIYIQNFQVEWGWTFLS